MKRADDWRPRRAAFLSPFLLLSLALHGGLGWSLYWFGGVQIEQRRQQEEVAASLQATAQASRRVRSERRVEDLHKIKQLMEESAQRASTPAAPPAGEPPQSHDLLEQARALSRDIRALEREIQAEELARLTGVPKQEALDEVLARPEPPPAADPAQEIAALEKQAREVLARRGEALQRKEDGVAVETSGASGKAGVGDGGGDGDGDSGAGAGNDGDAGSGPGIGTGMGSGDGQGNGGGGGAALSERIAAFVREGQMIADLPSQRYRWGGRHFFDAGGGDIPAVSALRMVKGQGRMLGQGGQFANRLYLNSWYVIGPFPGRHGGGLFHNPAYPPEHAVVLDAVYLGKNKRLLRWEYMANAGYPLIPRHHAEDAVWYGYTEVLMDRERVLTAWIGADDDARVWVNDQVVWKGGNVAKQGFFESLYNVANTYDRDWNRTEGQVQVRFRKGRNKVFFKLSNGPTRVFFSMVLTEPGRN